jgi:integrase
VARFILIAIYTGTRSRAVLDLQWLPSADGGYFDLDGEVLYRRGQGRRQSRKRQPPARIDARLLPHLKRWRKADLAEGITYVVHYRGGGVGKLRRSWDRVRKLTGLGPEVVPHTCRHTAATWQMQAGTSLYEAAGYLGMSGDTLWNVYGHHHPDFQEEAAKAFNARR